MSGFNDGYNYHSNSNPNDGYAAQHNFAQQPAYGHPHQQPAYGAGSHSSDEGPYKEPAAPAYDGGDGGYGRFADKEKGLVAEEPVSTDCGDSDFNDMDPNSGVKRGLKTRHLSMMALAGIIGPGLLVGAGGALAKGGPASLLIGFGVIGIIAFSIMQSLGELTTLYPTGGAFTGLADRFVDKAFGMSHRSLMPPADDQAWLSDGTTTSSGSACLPMSTTSSAQCSSSGPIRCRFGDTSSSSG